MKIIADNLAKIYNNRIIFKHVSFEVSDGDVFIITGLNGSGKSTLLKSLIKLVPLDVGKIEFLDNAGKEFKLSPQDLGLCAPYLNLYLNFTLQENLEFFNSLRGTEMNKDWLERSGINDRKNELLKSYSSGMLQRARLLFAILHEPELLILDEPSSNLDNEGFEFVKEIIDFQSSSNKITLVATNDDREKAFGNKGYELDKTN